jgi:NADP-dependent 3-hydroxy acid dehydrogenase YdfG
MEMPFQYKTALVTGASGGIGAATVKMLRDLGLEVHAIARREEQLHAITTATGAIGHVVDVTDTKSVAAIIDGLEIDVLVNNAGTTRNGKIDQLPEDEIDAIFDLNLRAVAQLTRLAARGMRARDRGHIVFIGSIAGLYPMAGSAPYAASKAAISQFANILRLDLLDTAVRTTEIVPGRVATDLFGVALKDTERAKRDFLDGKQALAPQDIAESIRYALATPQRVNVSRIEITPTRQAVGGFTYSDHQIAE